MQRLFTSTPDNAFPGTPEDVLLLAFNLGGRGSLTPPDSEAVEKINELLSEVSDKLELT